MPVPVTFSAPADETYEALAGFEPSREDSLRYAVWLLMVADDVIRAHYAHDASDAAAGQRIYQGRPAYDPQTLSLSLPCMIVDVDIASSRFEYSTSGAGKLSVVVGIAAIESSDTSLLSEDVDEPSLTAHAILARVDRALMRGTLYDEDEDATRSGRLVDPYRTPRNVDGTYQIPALKYLNAESPEITTAQRVKFSNRFTRTSEELYGLDPVRDFAVSCARRARYEIEIARRDLMR